MFLIEVGANDGIIATKTRDLILKEGYCGILIEPVKYYFNQLQKNYEGVKGLTLLNIGISTEDSTKTIYRINPKYLSENHYGHGVSSLNPNHAGIKRLKSQFGDSAVITEQIQIKTLANIIEKYNVSEIDLLVIDTEGNDFNVIQSLDFNVIKPKKIVYENKHLGALNKKCEAFLKGFGYSINRAKNDTYCEL